MACRWGTEGGRSARRGGAQLTLGPVLGMGRKQAQIVEGESGREAERNERQGGVQPRDGMNESSFCRSSSRSSSTTNHHHQPPRLLAQAYDRIRTLQICRVGRICGICARLATCKATTASHSSSCSAVLRWSTGKASDPAALACFETQTSHSQPGRDGDFDSLAPWGVYLRLYPFRIAHLIAAARQRQRQRQRQRKKHCLVETSSPAQLTQPAREPTPP
jgi:hypothetical protein